MNSGKLKFMNGEYSEMEWSKEEINQFKYSDLDKLNTGEMSSLNEDENSFYVVKIVSKANDKMKIAKIVWKKISFDSWWDKIKAAIPALIEQSYYAYALPVITAFQCTNNTWNSLSIPNPGNN